MKYEGTKFEVREYEDFPHRNLQKDGIIREFNDLETASYESIWLNKKAKMGERYYVWDNPHTDFKMTKKIRDGLRKNYNLI